MGSGPLEKKNREKESECHCHVSVSLRWRTLRARRLSRLVSVSASVTVRGESFSSSFISLLAFFSSLSLFLSSFLPFSGKSKIHSFSFRFVCTREFLRFSFCFRDNGKKLKLFYYICMIRVFIFFWILYFYSKFVCDSNL